MARTYRPPKGVQEEGQRAVQWIADGKAGSGFTDVGRKRAADLAAARPLSAETVLRMFSYLSRHEVDKDGQGFSPGEDGYPSPGRVAWAAWGGDPGLSWSRSIRDQMASQDEKSTSVEEDMEKRALPPSYRPASSEDVPVFRPACASCAYLVLMMDPSGAEALNCSKWDAPVAADQYCDAYEADDDCLPGWLRDDDDEDDGVEVSIELERAQPAQLGVGTFVSWDSSGGRAKGRIDKVVTSGRAQSSEGYYLDASEEKPVYVIAVYREVRGGWERTDVTVVHLAATLTVIGALPSPRSQDADLEARRSLIADADKRTFTSEVRAATHEDGTVQLVGYAAMWDQEADGLPFREVIKRGAFEQSLQRGDDVFLLVNHDTDALPLARRSAGTLDLVEDEVGLRVEAMLDPANPRAAELGSALSRGDVDKMSFAFRVADGGTTKTKDGVRELRTLDLFEVSVVTWPAYSSTSVGLRSADDDVALRWRFAQARARRRAA